MTGPAEAPPRAPAAYDLGGGALELPRDTTPTWEIELLVSGAVLFGLLQLPDVLHAAAARWAPHVEVLGIVAVAAVNVLLVGAVYALVACFVLHLALRAYWVALVGAHSVFPDGVRWEQMGGYGPIQAEVMRSRFRPLAVYVAWADNAASVAFASGFVLAAAALSSVTMLAALALPLWAAHAVGGRDGVIWTGAVLVALYVGGVVALQGADNRVGARLEASSPWGRRLRLLFRAMMASTPAGVSALSAVLVSHFSKRVVTAASVVGLTGAMAAAVATDRSEGRLAGARGYRFFADAGPGAVVAGRYATLRGDAPPSEREPWLDTDVVTAPYLRLFVPYRPLHHNGGLADACPGLRALGTGRSAAPTAAERAAAESVLACAARVHAVSVDGRAVPGLRFRFFADPRANRRGFLAYVPAGGLAAGEHLMTVRGLHARGRRGPPPIYELPFWK